MNWHSLNWIDFAILGIILLSALVSLIRGFVREALSLLVWIFALWMAFRYYNWAAARFLSGVESAHIRGPLAFLLIFLVIVILGAIFNFILSGMLYKTGLSGTDRLLGLMFGVARGILLVAVLILAAEMTAASDNALWNESQLIPQFQGLVEWIRSLVPSEIQKFQNQTKVKLPTEVSQTLQNL
ncbi:MAG: CvpA family protein [Gammaproteobacteria bacterium]